MRSLGVKMTAGGSWEGVEVVIIMILGGVESSVLSWKVQSIYDLYSSKPEGLTRRGNYDTSWSYSII